MVNASASYLQNLFKGTSNGNSIRASVGFLVPVGTRHNFQLQGNYLNNTSKDVTIIQNFNETNVQFIYGLTFKCSRDETIFFKVMLPTEKSIPLILPTVNV